ncbi:MAG: TetR/AcrR family transcriptional regulator [Microthrixaceae bacterium]
MTVEELTDTPSTSNVLLDAFEAEALRDGLANVGLRAVARRAGMSHAAPGHVFGSLAGMQRAAAERACIQLGEAVEAARAGIDDPFAALAAEGEAVLDWAFTKPVHFDLLFRAGEQLDPSVSELRGVAYGCFLGSIRLCFPASTEREIEDLALEIWATSIGIAGIVLDGSNPVVDRSQASRVIRRQIDRLAILTGQEDLVRLSESE